MVAVLACSQVRGGRAAPAIARPTARVDRVRDSLIWRRLSALYRQLTLRPARLMTASAPSNSAAHSSTVSPSHPTTRQGDILELRLSTTTSWPSATNARA